MDSVVEAWLEGLPNEAKTRLETFYQTLMESNEKMNLTAIVNRDEVYLKHFWDSVQVSRLPEWGALTPGADVIDVGTGAGFPGIPLSIVYPNMAYVLLDSLQKRLQFLNAAATAMDVHNITLIHGRAEDIAHHPEYRNRFDMAVSRAVARLSVLVELTLPFVKPGGYFVAYKGPGVKDELADAEKAAKRLGGEMVRCESFDMPSFQGGRNLVVFRQRSATPSSYPRKAGTPQKNPLS